ncbi:MAG: cupin [Methanoculleus sp. SDB]|nr:MAG: cupin [Methanoculleus sp. SDB]
MFATHDEAGYRESLAGIRQKTLVWGEKMLMTEFLLARGTTLPPHSHSHEQTGYLVAGHMTLSVGDERFDAKPGDSWDIPANTEHMAEIHEDSIAVEVFCPVREDYLPD